VHSANAATKGSPLAAEDAAAGSLARGRRRRRREEGGCSGGGIGSGSGVPVGEARRPPRNEFLGTPGWRSHEKGTREEVLARGDGAGDGDGQKVDEALETEEEDDDEDE